MYYPCIRISSCSRPTVSWTSGIGKRPSFTWVTCRGVYIHTTHPYSGPIRLKHRLPLIVSSIRGGPVWFCLAPSRKSNHGMCVSDMRLKMNPESRSPTPWGSTSKPKKPCVTESEYESQTVGSSTTRPQSLARSTRMVIVKAHFIRAWSKEGREKRC
jgi:hypothetical protein